MKLTLKISIFAVIYLAIFHYFRVSGYYNYRLLAVDVGSLPWLYSTIGLIFGVISAFIIQKEWNGWSDLVDSVKGECAALQELSWWSEHLPVVDRQKIKQAIKKYLAIIIQEGWQKTEEGETSRELEKAITELQEVVSHIGENNVAMSAVSFQLFSNITHYREKRLRFGSNHMPLVLRNAFRLSTFLIIFLSPLIAVRNIELDYIFTTSIAVLAFTIYSVAMDLEHPLRPGGWHLTTLDYQKVLARLEKEE